MGSAAIAMTPPGQGPNLEIPARYTGCWTGGVSYPPFTWSKPAAMAISANTTKAAAMMKLAIERSPSTCTGSQYARSRSRSILCRR